MVDKSDICSSSFVFWNASTLCNLSPTLNFVGNMIQQAGAYFHSSHRFIGK